MRPGERIIFGAKRFKNQALARRRQKSAPTDLLLAALAPIVSLRHVLNMKQGRAFLAGGGIHLETLFVNVRDSLKALFAPRAQYAIAVPMFVMEHAEDASVIRVLSVME